MKKLYLLFAFLFALIGYQDAGAWDWNGSSPTADNLKLMGEGFSGATWDGTGISSTWDSSESLYYWDVTATSGTIKFRFKADGTWISPAEQTLNVGTWSTKGMKDGNSGGNQSVTVTSGSTYRIKVKKSADYTAICVVENGGGSESSISYYLHTNVSGAWTGDNALPLEKKAGSDNEYTASYEVKKNGNIMVKAVGSSTEWLKGDGDSETLSDSKTSIRLKKDGSNDKCQLSNGTYTFTFNSSTSTLSATKTGGGKTISSVYLTNGSNETVVPPAGSDYVLTQALTLTSGYGFKVLYSDNSTATYGLASNPSKVNQAYSLTSGSSTFALSSDIFASVTGLTVTVSGTDLSTVSFAGTLKETPVGDVKVYLSCSGQDYELTKDGSNYVLNDTKITLGTSTSYWIKTVSGSTTKYYGPSRSGWHIGNGGNTDLSENGNNFCFPVTDDVSGETKFDANKAVTVTVKWSTYPNNISIKQQGDQPVVHANVNMPLKPSDFAGKKKHYFIVGTRMGGWRLQPEWELTAENGYSIKNRLMYTGYFMIAVVDDYNDYINQRYKAYSNTNTSDNYIEGINSSHRSCGIYQVSPQNSASLEKGMWTSLRYNEQATKDQFNDIRNKTIRFLGKKSDGGQGDPNNNDDMSNCLPVLADLTVTVDSDGNPTNISFSNVKTSDSDVAKEMTFSIVGSAFRNQSLDVDRTDARTPRAKIYTNDISKFEQGWQEGYIQFDSNSDPYVDNHGEFMYHTVFQSDYMKRNPVRFENSTGFKYTSNGLLFEYDATRTHDDHFNNVRFYTGDSEGSASNGTRDITSGKMCFVVNNVWMRGAFKIWTGWGGSTQGYQGTNAGDGNDGARWYNRNGGHSVKDRDRLIFGSNSESPVYFATANNVGAADFAVSASLTDSEKNSGVKAGVRDNKNGAWTYYVDGNFQDSDGTRTYFKRIELWWDPVSGFDNSVLYAYQEAGGPNIWIDYADKNHIGYNYDIPEENRQKGGDLYIKEYKIERLLVTIDDQDNESYESRGIVKEDSYDANVMSQEDFYGLPEIDKYITDTQELQPGNYRYRITVWYHGDANSPEGEVAGSGYKAYSNMLTIRSESKPTAAASQYTETKTEFGQSVTLYGFDAVITASAPESINDLADPSSESDTRTFADLLAGFKVTLPDLGTGNAFCTGASVEGEGYTATLSGNTVTVKGTVTETVDGKTVYRMPALTLHNVMPTADGNQYTFIVDMICDESNEADKAIWATYNAGSATASCSVEAPVAELQTPTVSIADDPVSVEWMHDKMPMHNVRHGHSYEHQTTHDWPVIGEDNKLSATAKQDNGGYGHKLSQGNVVVATGQLDRLAVTDAVLRDWNVDVDLHLTQRTTGLGKHYKIATAGNQASLNADGNEVTIEYLPVESTPTSLSTKFPEAMRENLTKQSTDLGYDFNYNAVSAPEVNYTVTTTYSRKSDSASSKGYVQDNQRITIDATTLFPAAGAEFTRAHGLQLHQATWQQWIDAFNIIQITHPGVGHLCTYGFFLTNGTKPAYYDPTDPQHKIYPGGHVLDCSVDYDNRYSDHFMVLPKRPSEAHFGESVSNKNGGDKTLIPVLVGNIKNLEYDPQRKKIEASDYSDAAAVEGVLLTTYPIAMMPESATERVPVVTFTPSGASASYVAEPVAEPVALADDNSSLPGLITIEVPSTFSAGFTGATTDIDDIEGDVKGSLTLFPNPAVDVVTVRSDSEIGKVEIISVDGSLVKTADIDDTAGTIDVSDMTSGLYIVRTQAGTARLIVR